MLNSEQADKFLKKFEAMDKNGDGFVDKEELKQIYAATLDDDQIDDAVDKVFADCDANGDG